MNYTSRCPECNTRIPADAPAGLCPKCLYEAGLSSEEMGGAPTRSGVAGRFERLSAERLARAFPQFESLELLGQGGMGAVYKARQPSLDRWVALKILPPELASDATFVERFLREAKTLARLGNHPHIVAVHDMGQADDLLFVVMEYVDGGNLRAAIRDGRIAPHWALSVVGQICEALQFAHDQGVVHRDIKPENILLDMNGKVKLADFGLAKLLSEDAQEQALTRAQQVLGTPRYMAPEQLEGSSRVDHRADIYSLGVVFYEILTGEVPLGHFLAPSKMAAVDARLDDVVLRALHRIPDDRYQHASEVKCDVEDIGTTVQPIDAKPAWAPLPAASRSPFFLPTTVLLLLLACLSGTLLLGLFGVGTYWLMADHDASKHATRPTLETLSSLANEGNVDKVRQLLKEGEDPNQIDELGLTPLLQAAIAGHPKVVKALLDAGAELEQRSSTGTTALMEAAFGGHLSVASVLLDGQADIKATDNEGRSALDHAVCTDQVAMTELLMKRGTQETGPYRTWKAHRLLKSGKARESYDVLQQALVSNTSSPARWQYQVGEWRYLIKRPDMYLEGCALESAQRLGEEEQAKRHIARLQERAAPLDAPIYVAIWLSPQSRAVRQLDADNFIEDTVFITAHSLAATAAEWRTPLELRFRERKMETRGNIHSESTSSGSMKNIIRF